MSADELNISAAVQRYEVSRKTVRRRLAEGAIEGAHQVPGDHGPEWVFPAASLEALGYGLRPSASAAGTDKGDPGPGTDALPYGTSDAPQRTPRRGLVLALAIVAGLLIGALGATLFRSDDPADAPLAALLEELTDPGDEIGVVGAPTDAALPAGRVPVPLDDLDNAPRYVVIGDDGDPAALDTLLAGAKPVLALDRPTGELWLFDTGSDPLPASATGEVTTTTATTEPAVEPAGPTLTTPTTTTPTVTSMVEPPSTTTPEPGPAVEPEPSEGDPSDPAVDPSADPRGPPPSITVVEGDSFWTIAEGVVADSLGTTPTDAQVTGYWAALVDANVDSLVQPGNPDLILPGQVFQLPPI